MHSLLYLTCLNEIRWALVSYYGLRFPYNLSFCKFYINTLKSSFLGQIQFSSFSDLKFWAMGCQRRPLRERQVFLRGLQAVVRYCSFRTERFLSSPLVRSRCPLRAPRFLVSLQLPHSGLWCLLPGPFSSIPTWFCCPCCQRGKEEEALSGWPGLDWLASFHQTWRRPHCPTRPLDILHDT